MIDAKHKFKSGGLVDDPGLRDDEIAAMLSEPDPIGAIIIEITGHPIGKGRARANVVRSKGGGIATGKNGRPIVKHYTPEKTRRWEEDARQLARMEMMHREPLTGPVEITIDAILAVPKSWAKWKKEAAEAGAILPTSKPDLDNIEKAAKDALNGIVWIDDAQVVDTNKRKRYGTRPAVIIGIRPKEGAGAQITRRADLT